MNAPVQAPSASVDALRYQLADALYVAEGRYGTLELDVRLGLDDEDTSGWADALRVVRGAVSLLIAEEFDARRMSGCVESLRLIYALLAALAAPAVQEAA